VIASIRSRVGLRAVGAAVPERVVTNAEIAERVETSDEWIVTRTGIRERRVAAPDEYSHDLALRAAEQALDRSGLAPAEIDLVVCATPSPASYFPSTAVVVAEAVGAHGAGAYDLAAACTGFPYALSQAVGQLQAGLAEHALVIGADTLSKVLDWDDRSTCILFGDGAGAAVVQPVEDGGIVGFELGADGSGGPDLCVPAGGSRQPASPESLEEELQFIRMNGAEVFRFATRVMVTSAEELLEACGASVEDVDLYVPHQANKRIVDHAVKDMGLDPEKVLMNIDRYGNTSSASIPICLAEAQADGRLGEGTRVLMSAVGAGLTWGSVYLTWTTNGSR
jgi:3-oxoacyl-[acyl-carrier-protein] synthase-3